MQRRFEEFGFPLVLDRRILPEDDDSTLFIGSGMQPLKKRFCQPDGGRHGSLQSCLRTDDIELVGDGSHLTYFEMIGNFSFGGHDYEWSVELWQAILTDLWVPVTEIRVHPSRLDHRRLWLQRGCPVVPDESCVWSDGEIGRDGMAAVKAAGWGWGTIRRHPGVCARAVSGILTTPASPCTPGTGF